MPTSENALRTHRLLNASRAEVFTAFREPARLARWWGPDGFTNTFETFEFKPGGKWVFVMHGPNGANYPNESVFEQIQPDARVLIRHVCQPLFTLDVTLTDEAGKTRLTWVQTFENAEIAAKLSAICVPANEQNLNRLEAELARLKSGK